MLKNLGSFKYSSQGGFGKDTAFIVDRYLQDASEIKHGDVRKWIKHVKQLLKDPNSFTYSDWCDGKLANDSFT